MEIIPIQTGSLLKQSAQLIIEQGYKMMKSAYKLNPYKVSYDDFSKWTAIKMPNNIAVVSFDYNLFLIDWTTWKDILGYDWTRTKKWTEDKYDCDNFAFTFAGHMSELFDISVSVVYGKLYKADGTFIDKHYWNAIFTREIDNTYHIYFFEPMYGTYAEYSGQGKVKVGNAIYESQTIYIF